MNFIPTALRGAYIIEPEKREDERGFFARTFCRNEFEAHGLRAQFVQCGVAFNKKRGTLRGLHYQAAPREEAKLVRCTRGSIYDVAVDLRPASPTLHRWIAVELSADNGRMLYAPEGCAHGYQTLEDETEVFYQMSEFYHPELAGRIRWDSPQFEIPWPVADAILSDDDSNCLALVRESRTSSCCDTAQVTR